MVYPQVAMKNGYTLVFSKMAVITSWLDLWKWMDCDPEIPKKMEVSEWLGATPITHPNFSGIFLINQPNYWVPPPHWWKPRKK